jgi:hypothetical protein
MTFSGSRNPLHTGHVCAGYATSAAAADVPALRIYHARLALGGVACSRNGASHA